MGLVVLEFNVTIFCLYPLIRGVVTNAIDGNFVEYKYLQLSTKDFYIQH